MARFRGRTEHILDSKGRLNFPSRFREALRQCETDNLMVTAWGKKHLRVYPESEWEVLENKILTKGQEQPGLASLVRFIIGGVNEVNLDKQGRLLLPQGLRNDTSLQKDVILIGMISWIEIWDRDNWLLENESSRESFDDGDDRLALLGIL